MKFILSKEVVMEEDEKDDFTNYLIIREDSICE